MTRLGKYSSVLLAVILAVSSLLIVKPIDAQSIPKPSVPHFTLRYSDNVDNRSIDVIINDQLPAHYNVSGHIAFLMYNIRWKNHTDNMWHSYSSYPYWGDSNMLISATNSYISKEPLSNDSSLYNTFTTNVTYVLGQSYNGFTIDNFSAGQQIDFQVEAFFGYYWVNNYKMMSYWFDYEESQWSSSQTVTIPITYNPSPSSTVPEFPITASLIAVLAAVSLSLIITKRKVTN